MRRAVEARGFSATIFYLCDGVNVSRPVAKNPEDERAKLQREFVEAAARIERLAEALRINHKLPEAMRAVK